MASQEPATGPAGLELRQGREGAETDWEAVTESEMKDTVTLAKTQRASSVVYDNAASNVEEGLACSHGVRQKT